MLKGRLGLEEASVPYEDRHGVVYLERGRIEVRDGCVRFVRGEARSDGEIDILEIPYQALSIILLGPGGSVTQDALRLLGRHGTCLAAVGEDGVRLYTAPPLMSGDSGLARRQAMAWADPETRFAIANRMYAWRFNLLGDARDLDDLRGMEGARIKTAYKLLAERYRIPWQGRRYDRENPASNDLPNQAINHAATMTEAAAAIACMAVRAVPSLGFIHEDPAQAFVLDIADLARVTVTVPVAFKATRRVLDGDRRGIERVTREEMNIAMRQQKLIPDFIEKIKALFGDTG